MKFSLRFGLAALGILAASLVLADGNYVPNEVLVKFTAGTDRYAANQAIHATEVKFISQIGVGLEKLPSGMTVDKALTYYRGLTSVQYAEPDYIAHATLTPNDPNYNQQYGPQKIQCPKAWDITLGSPNVTIAIIDTGIMSTHEDLAGKVLPGYNFVSNTTDATDDNGHGTHCSGIAAALTNNGKGIAGVAPNCKLMPVKVLDSSGSGTYDAVISGITYAADHGAKVLSMSLGGSSPSSAVENALAYALTKNALPVCAAGNNGVSDPFYPAYYDECIAVAATDSNDQKAGFSNFGDWVDVAAPGVNILSCYFQGGYVEESGTSMACPHVAGAAAMIYSRMGGSATPAAVRAKIEGYCDPVGNFVRKGRINLYRSLQAIAGGTSVPPLNIAMFEGTTFSGGLAQVLKADGTTFNVTSKADKYLGHVASATTTFAIPNSSSPPTQMVIQMQSSSVNFGSALYYLYNWNAARWDYVGGTAVSGTMALKNFTVAASSFSPYLNATRQMKMLTRVISPISAIHPSVPFTLKMDLIDLQF